MEFSDFLQMLGKVERGGDTEEELEEAFRVFDKDGSGKISIDELRHIMTSKGEKLTDEQASTKYYFYTLTSEILLSFMILLGYIHVQLSDSRWMK